MNSRKSALVFRLFTVILGLFFASCAEPLSPTLDLTPASETIISGQPLQLTVTRRFPGGPVENVTALVTYTSSDRSIAVVDERGRVTAGTQAGSVIIKAFDTLSDATAVAAFTVVGPSITAIDITPSPAVVLTRDNPRQFTAMGRFNNGTSRDVTKDVNWDSTNTAVAIVGTSQLDKGVVSAVADGETTISATDGTTLVQGRCIVFVTGGAPALTAIIVTPNPAKVGVGLTQEMTAIGVYGDGSTRNLTKSVQWSSSRTDVATIDVNGVVTGVKAGDTTITATGLEPSTTIKGSAAANVVP